ncbi:solute carrier family 22 member 13-like [Grus japonensis]|uniref:Solute carrier family 22 member 13-like n=1 Tax=Grus japonensis TaxID=30415 RepID=A0ABC9WIC5_GRUJA
MAGAKSRSETERLEHRLGHHQVQQVAMVGRGPQSQDWHNRTKKKTETREKPTSFNAQCSLQLAKHRQELNGRSVLLGNKLRTSWSPSETALVAADEKAGKGACSWKKPALSLQTYQAAGTRESRMLLRGQERKSAVETAVKGSFLPGVTYTKEREQVCSWPKTGEQRDGEKIGDGDMPKGKRGGKVSQRVAAIQQDKAQLKRPASASSPLVLEPVKSLPHGSLVLHHTTRQSTKPTNWMYLGGTGGCILSAAELPVKENKVCGSLSTPNKGGTMPAMTDDKPELTIAIPGTAGDKHHLGERMNSPQSICVTGEPKTRNTTSIDLKCGAEGVDNPENEAEEAHCLSGVSRTPYVSSGSLEPVGLSVSPEITELVNEKSKANTNEFPGKQIPVTLGENMQPSSISCLPGIESKGAESEKTKEVKPISTSGFLEEPSPEHTSQDNKAENSRVSSPGLPDKTDDHSVSCLQETEPQGTCGPLITNPHVDILRHDIKSPGKDFPVSADTPLKGTCATWSSHDEVNYSKSKDSTEVLSGNTFHISEQPAKTLDSTKPYISLDKSGRHPVGEEKMDLKLPGESTVHTSRPGSQSKETRSSQVCREMLGKGFRLEKNPFTMLFGSEDKGSTPKKETATQRKPTKPQSTLVTLFGYSSKKHSQGEKPARSSEQTNIDDRPEKPQGLLSSSSQAKQKASKNDQLPQPGKMEVFPKHIQESSGGFSDCTEGKETDVLLLAPGTNISCDDKHERTELDIHDQRSQVWQPQDSCWPSLMPAQEKKEAAVISEGGTNPLHPPPELMPAADNSKNLIREGNHHDAHLLEMENLLSLDVQDTVTEDGIYFSPGNLEKLPRKAELQLDNMDFLEDSNLFFSGGQDFPSIASKNPNSDLQNSEAETPSCFDPNPSELCQEIPAETNAPLVLWDTSSLLLLAGQDEINIKDSLQQLDPQCQAPKAAEDTFGLGLSAEGSTNKHLSMQEDNFPPMYACHASENFNQGVFDPFNVDSTKMGQEAPAKMNSSRNTSEVEEDYESLSSVDLNVLNDGLLDQEFFI